MCAYVLDYASASNSAYMLIRFLMAQVKVIEEAVQTKLILR